MHSCSVVRGMKIERGGRQDYLRLKQFHYRQGRLGAFAAIFVLRPAVGVIVYTMPSLNLELRNTACGGLFSGLDRPTRLALVNGNVRCIGRVIIEPRYRGLGLAGRLVRETMPLMDVPVVESLAVMGQVNPFFVKAGMTEYRAPLPARCVQMTEALSFVGIEGKDLLDAAGVEARLQKLDADKRDFIEHQIRLFLQSYGKRRRMAAGIERTRYVLSKLTYRPAYYIWFNPDRPAIEA